MMTDRPKCSAHRKLNVKTNNNNEIPCDSELCHDFSRLSHSEEEIPSELPSKAKSVIKPRSKDELKRTVSFAKFDNLVEYSSEKWMGTSRDVVSKSNKFHDSPIAYKRSVSRRDIFNGRDIFNDCEPPAKRKRLEMRQDFLCPPVTPPSQLYRTSTTSRSNNLSRSNSFRWNSFRSYSTSALQSTHLAWPTSTPSSTAFRPCNFPRSNSIYSSTRQPNNLTRSASFRSTNVRSTLTQFQTENLFRSNSTAFEISTLPAVNFKTKSEKRVPRWGIYSNL